MLNNKQKFSINNYFKIYISLIFIFPFLIFLSWYFTSYSESPRYENYHLNSFLTKNQKSRLDELGVSKILLDQADENSSKNMITYYVNGERFRFERMYYVFRYINENNEKLTGHYFHFTDNSYIIENNENVTFLSTSRIDDIEKINENIRIADGIINAVDWKINKKEEIDNKNQTLFKQALSTDDYYSEFNSNN